ncbi:peptidoglycan-binding domain-containing protein [Kiloniella sp. b19]|uniref:peptidoglycan-binding domain-containing protein n=1 Tax=Kiloniella sp. GXU_MW_B19 TaxID=3141326 RepID=UPI0031D59745
MAEPQTETPEQSGEPKAHNKSTRFRMMLARRILLVSSLFIVTTLIFAFQTHLTPTLDTASQEEGQQTAPNANTFSKPEDALSISYGLSVESLTSIEQMLFDLQLDPGTIDGVIDQETTSAISVYQRITGLSITGLPSLELLENLKRTVEKLKNPTKDNQS